MSLAVTEQQIVHALHAVPADRWDEVLRFLNGMQGKSSSPPESSIQTADDLLNSGLIGIRANRTDLGENRDFARRLREQAEQT